MLQGIPLDDEVMLLLASVRPVDDDDFQAIRAAAAPLVKLLEMRSIPWPIHAQGEFMIKPLPLLTDDQVHRSVPTDEESGFGSLATERGPLPLQAMDVQARIDGLLATVDLCQTFVNTLSEPLEATYIFPLPDRAAIRRFRMDVAGRVIEGIVQERAQVRKEYEQAIQQGHRAAITEEERPNVFTLRVGNLMPGEQATVRLTLIGLLPVSDGEATFRFPLVVAPRYIPGTPLTGPSVGDGTAPDTDAVPDASRITPPVLLPGYPNPVRLALSVDVRSAGLPLSDIRSSLQAVLTEEEGQVRRIRLQPGERLDRDFILRFRIGDGAVKTALVLTPDEDGKEGTFALTIVPPAGQVSAIRQRDVVFILDRSGSMGGWKIVATRRALARMVDTLSEQDRFSVLAFDNTIETVPDFHGVGLAAATNRNRFRAVEFLSTIDARGGTELAQPLDLGVRQLTSGEAAPERILVLVTDGQVGNEDQFLRSLAPHLRNLRIFTLGIDQAVNEGFLHRLAALGGGMCEVVESEERLDEVLDKVHRRIGTPVLTALRLEPAGLLFDPESLVPVRMPDVFSGVPLCILGRYSGAATGGFALQARDAAGKAWAATVPAISSDNPAIASIWARGHIRELGDHFACGSADCAKLEKRIIQTSLRLSVLSRFTAFVAVDRSEVVDQGGQVQRITQPVKAPAGWAMFGTDGLIQALSVPCIQGQPLIRHAVVAHAGPFVRNASGVSQRLATLKKEDPTADILRKSAFENDRKSLLEALTPNFPTVHRMFEQADCHIKASSIFGIGLLLGVLGTTGNWLARVPWFFAPLVGLVFFFIPWLWVLNKRRVRLKRFAAQLPDALELVARALRAGHSLVDGMHVVAEDMPAPIADEFGRSFYQQNLGIPFEHSIRNIYERVPNVDLRFFVTSVAIQRQTGGDLADTLDRVAYVIRFIKNSSPAWPYASLARIKAGLLHAIQHVFSGNRCETHDRASAPRQLDLSAYSRCCQELLEPLQDQAGKDAATQLRELRSLALKVESLIVELKSIGADEAELRPLEALLRTLNGLRSERGPNERLICAATSAAEAVLGVFVGSPAGRREAFWK